MRIVALVCLAVAVVPAQTWNRFRGDNGSGLAPAGAYPENLDRERSLVWRAAVRPGKSSPILTRDHVLVTASDGDKLFTQCFDRRSGRLLWERAVDRRDRLIANRLNHPAAITPVTDGRAVYSFFKDFGLVAYSLDGKELWRTPLGPFNNTMGLGASPILSGGKLFLVADQVEGSFAGAFDVKSGEMVWRRDREEGEGWGSPLWLGEGTAGQLLTASRGQLGLYEPEKGTRQFTLRGLPTTVVGSPVLAGGVLYVQGYGADAPAPFSQRLEKLDANKDGKLTADEYGDEPFLAGIAKYVGNRDMVITEDEWNLKQKEVMGPNCLVAYRLYPGTGESPRAEELWRYNRSFTGVIPTPIVVGTQIYFVRNGGILTSLHTATGEMAKTGRIPGALGGYSASPVAAGSLLYFASEDGSLSVVRAGNPWEVLSVSNLGEGVSATPALADGSVFVRGEEGLFRFDRK